MATLPTTTRTAEAAAPTTPIVGSGNVYGGLYPNQFWYSGDFDAIAAQAWRKATFAGLFHTIYESDTWAATRLKLDEAWNAGATPFSNLQFDVSAATVAGGSLDAQITSWANHVKEWLDQGGGRSLIIAPMQEMNGDWIPYGMDPTNYKLGYAKIRTIVESTVSDPDKVRWAFAPNGWSTEPYGLAHYYPGDDIVDVIGLSTYNFGDYDPWNGWISASTAIQPYVDEARALPGAAGKPFVLAQTGVVTATGDKNQWIRDMFTVVEEDPNVVGFIYFNTGHNPHDWVIWEGGTQYTGWVGYRDGMRRSTTKYQFPLTNWFQPGPLPFVQYASPCPDGGDCDSVAFVNAGSQINLFDEVSLTAGTSSFYYGAPGDVALFGDWDGDGVDTPGMWRQGPGGGFAYLTNTLPPDGGVAVAETDFFFGAPGDRVFVGDWDGDGKDSLGINRNGHIFLTNTNGSGGLPVPTHYDYWYGVPGDRPFAGDFDGDGYDTVGLYRESTGFVYFRNSLTTGFADSQFFYGEPSDRILAGDWNGNGTDTIAVYRPSTDKVYFRMTNTFGNADFTLPVGPGFVEAMAAR